MVVMGGIVGAGIFVTPATVAVSAELGARRPQAGGQYVYLREALHPTVAFL
jgi:basic amino acid/polyamine antiporter, APA family